MAEFTLPHDLYSPDQLSALVLELGDYRSALQDARARAKTGSKKPATPPAPSPILASILEDIGEPTAANIDVLHTQLETLLNKAPVAHILLAGAPNSAIKRQLTEWFRTEISPYMLLTFSARSDLGGGIVLQAGSHVYDFSFKRQLIANKQKITEIASRVR